jgi:hypothetical protein
VVVPPEPTTKLIEIVVLTGDPPVGVTVTVRLPL